MDDEKMLNEVEQELAEMKATLLGKREEDPAEESGNKEDPDGGAEKTDHRKLDVNFIYVEAVEENEGPAPEKEAEKEEKMPAGPASGGVGPPKFLYPLANRLFQLAQPPLPRGPAT